MTVVLKSELIVIQWFIFLARSVIFLEGIFLLMTSEALAGRRNFGLSAALLHSQPLFQVGIRLSRFHVGHESRFYSPAPC